MEQISHQNSILEHNAMDTDMPAVANGSLGDTSHGSQSEEATEMNGPANGEIPLEGQLNGESGSEPPTDDKNGTPPESDSNEATKMEQSKVTAQPIKIFL